MDYSKIIDLDNVTVFECEKIYENENLETIINDGRIINFSPLCEK